MSGQATPATDSTPAPQPESAAPAPAASESATPAAEAADEFIPDASASDAAPSTEGKAEETKADDAKPEGEAEKDFLAETDDDDAKEGADGQADAKPEDAAEAYQPFTLPEGVELDEATLAKATPLFRKLNLDQDGAQELVSLYADITKETVQAYHDTLAEGHANTLKAWAAETKAHPEFGGQNLAASKAAAAQALALEPGARKVLVEYGLDRNPHVFALLARIGTKLSPDSLVRDDAGASEKSAPMRSADVMYS